MHAPAQIALESADISSSFDPRRAKSSRLASFASSANYGDVILLVHEELSLCFRLCWKKLVKQS